MAPQRVLVVDDERSLTQVVASYLERAGYTVECAFDDSAALAAAQRCEPDVVVLDLMLPGADGLEVYRRLHTFSNRYVVMVTVRADEADKPHGPWAASTLVTCRESRTRCGCGCWRCCERRGRPQRRLWLGDSG
jgi:CheY-like chemotaxis protein